MPVLVCLHLAPHTVLFQVYCSLVPFFVLESYVGTSGDAQLFFVLLNVFRYFFINLYLFLMLGLDNELSPLPEHANEVSIFEGQHALGNLDPFNVTALDLFWLLTEDLFNFVDEVLLESISLAHLFRFGTQRLALVGNSRVARLILLDQRLLPLQVVSLAKGLVSDLGDLKFNRVVRGCCRVLVVLLVLV